MAVALSLAPVPSQHPAQYVPPITRPFPQAWPEPSSKCLAHHQLWAPPPSPSSHYTVLSAGLGWRRQATPAARAMQTTTSSSGSPRPPSPWSPRDTCGCEEGEGGLHLKQAKEVWVRTSKPAPWVCAHQRSKALPQHTQSNLVPSSPDAIALWVVG